MKAKKWTAALLAGALMLCGLPAYADPTWTAPEQVQTLQYTLGERGFIEQDEQKIQQVLKTLQQAQPKLVDLNPENWGGDIKSKLVLTEKNNRSSFYQFDPVNWGKHVRSNYLFWSVNDQVMALEQQLQKRMKEIDPYGRFTWAEGSTCICLLDNAGRHAVFEELHENKNFLLERLQNLGAVKGSDEKALGKQLSGVSEMRIQVKVPLSDSITWSYQLYEKGVKAVPYTVTGKGREEIYLCPNETVSALKAQMQKTYDAMPEKTSTWFAIINPDRVTSLTVERSGEKPISLTDISLTGALDLLRSLPVGQAEKKTALWKAPETEYRITFANGLLYRVQQLKNKLRIWSSDMDFLLEYTISPENQKRLNEGIQSQIRGQQEGFEKPNPETAKPVIYLYPKQTQKVRVQLDFHGKLTSTYPTYPKEGWTVTAQLDGTLTDKQGRSYRYLFWEGTADTEWVQESGFFVTASQAQEFLERTLSQLGLNELEQNDFITYWLPRMQEYGECFVSFSEEQYTEVAKLDISPKPDTVIRVQMLLTQVNESNREYLKTLPEQTLPSVIRSGFTAVEWGGTDLSYPEHIQ